MLLVVAALYGLAYLLAGPIRRLADRDLPARDKAPVSAEAVAA